LYFAETRFVLSHTGWPWVDEALAMTAKHPNVYLGTASWPPRKWSPALVEFARSAGRGKVVFGTNYPTVGHRRALSQIAELGLPADAEAALLGGAARQIFTRLANGGVP
jgi:predicted TIM-barrel fold metal-dependent hydrolase